MVDISLVSFCISKKSLLGNVIPTEFHFALFCFGPKMSTTLLIDKIQSQICFNYTTPNVNNPTKILCYWSRSSRLKSTLHLLNFLIGYNQTLELITVGQFISQDAFSSNFTESSIKIVLNNN